MYRVYERQTRYDWSRDGICGYSSRVYSSHATLEEAIRSLDLLREEIGDNSEVDGVVRDERGREYFSFPSATFTAAIVEGDLPF